MDTLSLRLAFGPSTIFALLFILCFHFSSSASSSFHSLVSNRVTDNGGDAAILFSRTFMELMSGLLKDDCVLLLFDKGPEGLQGSMEILANVIPSKGMIIANQENFLNKSYPTGFIRGSSVTTILVFQKDPTDFLNELNKNGVWNPKYLVLWLLDVTVNAAHVIGHPVSQRSERISMFRLIKKVNQFIFEVSTSYPVRTSARGQKLVLSPLGFWNPERFLFRDDIFPFRYKTFGGEVLELATWCDDTPFMYNINGTCMGAMLDAVAIIGDKLNFNYEPQFEPVDLRWGSKENGTWVGMLGDLIFNGKHLVINDFLLNEARARDFDFTYPYHSEGFAFLVRLPQPLPKWLSLLHPFTEYTWVLTILSTVIASTLISGILSVFYKVKDPVDISLKVMSGMLRQNVELTWAASDWSRVWLTWWWLAAFILSSAYTSNLIAVLTIPVYPKRIETLEELAASDIRPWVLDYGNLVPVSLRTSADPTLSTLGAKLEVAYYDYNDPYTSFFKTLPGGTFALIEAFYYLGYLQLSAGAMGYSYIMKDQIYKGHLSWFLPKNTPYTDLISNSLQRLREAGIVDKLFLDHTANMRNQARKTKLMQQSRGGGVLLLSQLQGAFLLWLFGLAAAALAFLLENMVARLRQKTRVS